MKRKFVRVMFFGALALSTVTYVGCKDYDDDIDNLQTQIDANKASIAELQRFVNDGKWVTNVESISGGFRITFSDNKTYEVVNGATGATGATGAAGAPGSKVTIDPTTGEWLIDGVSTGWFAVGKDGADGKDGVDGKSPYINEDGYWCYWDEDGNPVTGDYAQTSVYLVQEINRPAYTLHISVQTQNADGTFSYTPTTVNLPNADAVSSIKAVNISNDRINNWNSQSNPVELYFGRAVADVEFNGESYTQNQVLTSNSGEIYAQVNPSDVDFSKYSIYLQNTKGTTAYEVKSVTPYDELMTRAASLSGLYKLKIGFVKNANFDDIKKNGFNVAYALATKNAFDKTILSEYNVAINSIESAYGLEATALTPLNKTFNEEHLLTELLEEAGVSNLDRIVDYTVETTSSDVVIDNKAKTIKSPKGQTVGLTVKYLKVDGTTGTLSSRVVINFCEMVTVGDITLTIKEGMITFVAKAAFDDKANALLATGAAMVAPMTLSDGTILTVSPIAGFTDKYELVATFDPSTVVETQRTEVLNFMAVNAILAKADAKIKVTVDNNDVFKFHQKEIYFTTENKAIVYGTPSTGGVTHNLFDLLNEEVAGGYAEFDFETESRIDFEETPPTFADGTMGRPWIDTDGYISVPKQRVTDNDGVKSTRPFVAKYYQFGNRNLTPIECNFDLTIESAIEQGTHADLPVIDGRTLSMSQKQFVLKASDFVWKDVYGATIDWATDTRIVSMVLTPNAIASQYIDLSETDLITTTDNTITVALKADLQQIVKDELNSAITLTVTDQWGVQTKVNIPVPIRQ